MKNPTTILEYRIDYTWNSQFVPYVTVTSILQNNYTELVIKINTVQPGTREHKRYKGVHVNLDPILMEAFGSNKGIERIWYTHVLKMPI